MSERGEVRSMPGSMPDTVQADMVQADISSKSNESKAGQKEQLSRPAKMKRNNFGISNASISKAEGSHIYAEGKVQAAGHKSTSAEDLSASHNSDSKTEVDSTLTRTNTYPESTRPSLGASAHDADMESGATPTATAEISASAQDDSLPEAAPAAAPENLDSAQNVLPSEVAPTAIPENFDSAQDGPLPEAAPTVASEDSDSAQDGPLPKLAPAVASGNFDSANGVPSPETNAKTAVESMSSNQDGSLSGTAPTATVEDSASAHDGPLPEGSQHTLTDASDINASENEPQSKSLTPDTQPNPISRIGSKSHFPTLERVTEISTPAMSIVAVPQDLSGTQSSIPAGMVPLPAIEDAPSDLIAAAKTPTIPLADLSKLDNTALPSLHSVNKPRRRVRIIRRARKVIMRRRLLKLMLGRELGGITHAQLKEVQSVANAVPMSHVL